VHELVALRAILVPALVAASGGGAVGTLRAQLVVFLLLFRHHLGHLLVFVIALGGHYFGTAQLRILADLAVGQY
jgi:hypothetical protein